MTTSRTDTNHPYYEAIKKLYTFEKRISFLKESKRMKYTSLGEALDLISGGGMNYVSWNLEKRSI